MRENQSDTIILAQIPSTGVAGGAESSTVEVAEQAPAAKPVSEGLMNVLMIPLFLVVIYFLLHRPQAKKEKARKESLKKMEKGDKVITRGGIWGVVSAIKEDTGITVVKIAENVKIEVSTDAIEAVNPGSGAKKEVKEKK